MDLEARVTALCHDAPASHDNILESFLQIVHDREYSAEGFQRLLDLELEARQQEKEKPDGKRS